jgi:CubicO group peptidase (beta-lactamase class C family)
MRRRKHGSIRALLVATALVVAACGSGDETDSAGDDGDNPSSTTTAPSSTTTGDDAPDGGYASAISDELVDNPDFDEIEAQVVGRLEEAGLPGAGLLVVHEGELVEHEAWLDYDLDVVVPIASGSKWLTAATIMTLVDEGLIDLDAPISTYVPELEARDPGAITMRHLLSFTSGLAADVHAPCVESGDGTLQECARQIVGLGPVHPPGEAFRYGSQHMHVAAAIAEVVTGTPYADLFQERIAEPLGMTSTRFHQIGQPAVQEVTHPLPAGGASSSMADYGRFLEMLVHDGVAPDGTQVLSAESVTEMQTDQIADARYATASEFRIATKGPYALGNWIDWTDETGAATVWSSDGKFGFRPWIDATNDLFGVYLIDDRGSGYVEGDPDAPADDAGKVHTSGLFIFEWTAEAVGGSLPREQYPHR